MPTFGEHPARRPAVVSGASAGIGAAVAQALAAAGYPVAIGARRLPACQQLAEAIRAAGGQAVAAQLDVTDAASVAAFHAAVTAELGDIEIVVCNAGGMRPGRLWELDTDAYAVELDTNVLGTHRLLTTFGADMVGRGRGDFVVISSDVVAHPRPRLGSYVSAKWALEGMVRVLQMELEGTGVRASIVRPGPTRTEIAVGWEVPATIAVVKDAQKWGLIRHTRALRPEQVALAVVHAVTAPRGVNIAAIDVEPEATPEAAQQPEAGANAAQHRGVPR